MRTAMRLVMATVLAVLSTTSCRSELPEPAQYFGTSGVSESSLSSSGESAGVAGSILAGKKLQWPDRTIQEQYQGYGHYTNDGTYVITTWRFCSNGRYRYFHQEAASSLTILNEANDSGAWSEFRDASGNWLRLTSDTEGVRDLRLETLSNDNIIIINENYEEGLIVVDSIDDSDC